MVRNGAFSHKIDCITIFVEIINFKGRPNGITRSRVMAILIYGRISPIAQSSKQ